MPSFAPPVPGVTPIFTGSTVGGPGGPTSGGGLIADIGNIGKDWLKKQLGLGGGTSSGGPPAMPGGGPVVDQAGMGQIIAGAAKRVIPGIVEGVVGYWIFDKLAGWVFKPGKPHRRRMNPLNPKALHRADRRVTSFGRIAKKELQHMGYTVGRHHPKPLKKKHSR